MSLFCSVVYFILKLPFRFFYSRNKNYIKLSVLIVYGLQYIYNRSEFREYWSFSLKPLSLDGDVGRGEE